MVLKDRFLSDDKPENPYVVAALYFLVFLLSALLIFVCFFQLCEIKGQSMENTLYNSDHVLLYRNVSTYKHNDIVVITKESSIPNNPENIIKRVIAVPGDEIEFKTENGVVVLYRKDAGTSDFYKVNESYIKEDMHVFSGEFAPGTGSHLIADGTVFVMGDNRNNSGDSRADGAYWTTAVYGKMALRVEKGSWLEWVLKLLYHENNAPAN